jgi:Mrp family chromosome partitioning ATPase
MNRRVLLIDADIRKARLGEIFELPPGPGLSDLLNEADWMPDAILGATQPTKVPGLSVLTSGTNSGTFGDLLFSGRLPRLLNSIRLRYRHPHRYPPGVAVIGCPMAYCRHSSSGSSCR